MHDESSDLVVGFAFETTQAYAELLKMQSFMESAVGKMVLQAREVEQATRGIVSPGASAAVSTFANASNKAMQSLARETAAAEKAGDRMLAQLERQQSTFGKTASEIRGMNAELRATRLDSVNLTDLAGKIRAAEANMVRLESTAGRATQSLGGQRAAMQGLSFQAQDAFTQISMGTNVLSVLAIQGGQAAGQMTGMTGAMGSVARFMIGPWGLAITGGMLLLGSLTKGMFDNEEASKAAADGMAKFQSRQADIGNFIDSTTGKLTEQNRTLIINATLTRQAQIADNEKSIAEARGKAFRAAGSTFQATRAAPGSTLGGVTFTEDTQVQKVIQGAGGSVLKLTEGLAALSKTRPSLAALALNVSNIGGQAAFAEKQNADLRKELRALSGDTTALARATKTAEAAHRGHTAAKRESLGVDRAAEAEAKKQQAAFDAEIKAAQAYADAQSDMALKMGLTAEQTRAYADAVAIAKAPTDALKLAIRDAAAARETAYATKGKVDFEANVMKPLRDELALYGLVGPARAAAALALEQEAFTTKNGAEAWKQYRDAKAALIGKDTAAGAATNEAQRQADAAQRMREQMDDMVGAAHRAGQAMHDAFGRAGGAIGDAVTVLAEYQNAQKAIGASTRLSGEEKRVAMTRLQIEATGDLIGSTKSLFKTHSTAYKAMEAAEKVYRVAQLAMSLQSMVQNAIETTQAVASAGVRATAEGTAGIASQSKLTFPYNIVAMAATGAALVAAGVSIFGGGGSSASAAPVTNTGTGSVLGDPSAKSESLKRAIDALKEVDTLTNTYAREMAASLRSIQSQIGNVASLVSRAGNVNASAGVTEGFKTSGIGSVLSKIPLIGGLLGSLFGSTTTVTGNGLYGGAQSVGSILGGGFSAQYYSDIQKKSKFLGITTGTKNSTQFTGADAGLQNQFTLILKQFNDAIVSAAGPLASSTGEIQNRLNGFIVNIGKIDLKGLTGTEIEEKLSAVFGAAADGMANAAFPGLQQFQRVGEGTFETLVRVASTVEAVTNAMDKLGGGARGLGMDIKLALADQFDSVSDLTAAVDGYFSAFYTKEEQAAAKQAELGRVFGSLGLAVPGTLSAFRQLVEAQNLMTAAGQSTYATLLKLAPAFADLQTSIEGVKSAADVASERMDLQRQLLQLQGNTAALRALDLAKIDASNRGLQEQVWAVQDAQEAAKAADELRKAWSSIGDGIMAEVQRIRGLTGSAGGTNFATLMGQFNAATAAARGGDQDAAKNLPGISQALLAAAALAATSRQELDRVQAQTAASLEATNAAIGSLANVVTPAASVASLMASAATTQAAITPANDTLTSEIAAMRAEMKAELSQLRADTNAGSAAIASNTGGIKRTLESVTADSGGVAFSVAAAA